MSASRDADPAARAVATARDSGVMAQLPRVRAPTPIRFIVYAYGLTWLMAWPLVLSHAGILPQRVPFWLHYLTGFGPLVAAAIVAFGEGNGAGVLAWARSLVRPVAARWWLVAVSPLIACAIVMGMLVALGKPVPPFADFGRNDFLAPMPVLASLALWTLTSGLGEEAGWRGILQPILQHLYGPWRGTVMVGIVWAGWHAPFFFYIPGYLALSIGSLVGFALALTAGAIVLAWLRNVTGSVLPCIVWHGCFNLVTASRAGQGTTAAVLSGLVVAAAVTLLIVTEGRLAARPSAGDPMPA